MQNNDRSNLIVHLRSLFLALMIATAIAFATHSLYKKFRGENAITQTKTQSTTIELGTPIPSLTFKKIDGSVVQLQQEKRIQILHFWASWCTPCVEEIPQLITFSQKFSDKAQIVAISQDSNIAEIKVFLKSFPKLESNHLQLTWDEQRIAARQLQINKLPESLIFVDGKLTKRLSGAYPWDQVTDLNQLIN